MLFFAGNDYETKIYDWLIPSSSVYTKELQDFIPTLTVKGVGFTIYHTKSGETFSALASRFHVSEQALRSLNQANFNVEPGSDTAVIIPSKNGIYHIVRQGQGLADIARAYRAPLKEILRANQIKGDEDLRPGEILFLPQARYITRNDFHWITLCSIQSQKGFLKPTTGRFADGFGMRRHPITGKMAFHYGLDLAPGWRARVVASQDGRVDFAGIKPGFGRLIVLNHGNGLTSWYAHLDQIFVKLKENVKKGTLIGKVGKSGKVTGPHLHFEIRLNGKPQNPLLYLAK